MFNIKQVTIIRLPGHPDKIQFLVAGPSPWPKLDETSPGEYEPHLQIECMRGFAEEWLTGMGFNSLHAVIIP